MLLISYHFPPAETVGALRWQKFVRHAAERGWQFDVIAVNPGSLKSRDDTRFHDLPQGTRVYGVAPQLLRVQKINLWMSRLMKSAGHRGGFARTAIHRNALRWWPRRLRDVVRAYFAWIDAAADAQWARDAADVAMQVYRAGCHRAVVTSGPPHMVHLAGHSVARWTGLPHAMDMRDPWSLLQRLPEHAASPVAVALAQRNEQRIVAAASLVVANTDPLRDAMANLYPAKRQRIIAVTNGADDDDVVPAPPAGGRFVIAYAGTIYLDRNPRPLFRAAARVIRASNLDPSRFSIELMGEVG
jgi:hypothetical protein